MSLTNGTDNEVLAKILAEYLTDITPHGWSWRITSYERIILECDDKDGSIRLESTSVGEIKELLARIIL